MFFSDDEWKNFVNKNMREIQIMNKEEQKNKHCVCISDLEFLLIFPNSQCSGPQLKLKKNHLETKSIYSILLVLLIRRKKNQSKIKVFEILSQLL